MEIVLLIILGVIALAVRRIAMALTRIDSHNRRFTPAPEPGEILTEGTVLILKGFGTETLVTVTGFAEDSTGAPACVVEPV